MDEDLVEPPRLTRPPLGPANSWARAAPALLAKPIMSSILSAIGSEALAVRPPPPPPPPPPPLPPTTTPRKEGQSMMGMAAVTMTASTTSVSS